MRERPILFSGPMIRAIIAGKKTQTRRLVSPARFAGKWLADCEEIGARGDVAFDGGLKGACEFVADPGNYPPYVAGDRLWVRETWQYAEFVRGDVEPMDAASVVYRADCTENGASAYACADGVIRLGTAEKWRPSIYMPRWACRLVLEVTDVRVERLQDISESDAMAEGVLAAPFCKAGRANGLEHVEAFEDLWNKINGKRAPWSSDPWVWVVGFKRVDDERGEVGSECLA